MYTMKLQMTIENKNDFNRREGLTVTDSIDLNVETFLEIAKVLGQFHDLVTTLKMAHKASVNADAT